MNTDGTLERRRNRLCADLVDVGLLYIEVFGSERGLTYFKCTIVPPHVYCRVLLGDYRGGRPVDDADVIASCE